MKPFFLNFSELVVFKHTIFAMPFITVAIFLSASIENIPLSITQLFFCLIAIVTARSFAMGVNRYVDVDVDKKNPRTANRPSVDGRINKSTQAILILTNASLFVISTYFINETAFYLSLPVLFILGAYSYTKRYTYFAHIFLGLSIALSVLAGDIAITQNIHLWSFFLFMGVSFWVTGFDILYSLQDYEFDIENNLYSIPVKFGMQKSFQIVNVLHLLAVLFWALFIYQANLGVVSWMALFVASALLAYENIISQQNINYIDKTFFTINGYISIGFCAFVVLDIVQG